MSSGQARTALTCASQAGKRSTAYPDTPEHALPSSAWIPHLPAHTVTRDDERWLLHRAHRAPPGMRQVSPRDAELLAGGLDEPISIGFSRDVTKVVGCPLQTLGLVGVRAGHTVEHLIEVHKASALSNEYVGGTRHRELRDELLGTSPRRDHGQRLARVQEVADHR